jgi:hypothetical protein
VARFVVGQSISTTVGIIDVDPGLPVGRHRFQLEVVDAERNVSRADVAEVEIVDLRLPPTRLPTETILVPRDPVIRTPVINPIRTPLRTPTLPIDEE